ncbi:hypothetical protein N7451_000217 [Penicillium sp. IBT 35674x]|nr:hypothetical protein N7451_000217 [Penicillium sp. IBT 35674x]
MPPLPLNDIRDEGSSSLQHWQKIAHQKRTARDRSLSKWLSGGLPTLEPGQTYVRDVPRLSGLLTEEQLCITDSSPSLLLRHLASGNWTAESVIRAFIARATIAHTLTNPLTEVFFDRAVERARQLDNFMIQTGKPIGPLHGLPMSLKDVLHVYGEEATLGVIALVGCKSQTEDRLVTKLHEAGVVFYCKTNVPQTLMSGECNNFIFGRTSTPFNISLSAGGSSGGEASLISLGGSPLGIGSDVAGSIRTPANFNGIYGLCPTPDRLPSHSAENTDGLTIIRPVAGPLSRSVDGLEVYTRAILSMKPWEWDFSSAKIPWREEEYEEGLGKSHRLAFAFMPHDSVVLPDPPILRGMQETKNALRRMGHQVIDIEPFDGKELMDIAYEVYFADGGAGVREMLSVLNEPLIKEVREPDPSTTLSVRQYQACAIKVKRVRQKYLDIWQTTSSQTDTGLPVDAIILPSGGTVAPPHGTMEYFTYEAISNVLEWSCATIPVTQVNPTLDCLPEKHVFEPMSVHDQRNHDKC